MQCLSPEGLKPTSKTSTRRRSVKKIVQMRPGRIGSPMLQCDRDVQEEEPVSYVCKDQAQQTPSNIILTEIFGGKGLFKDRTRCIPQTLT
eukprot:127748-Amphidinium_carterae.1